LDNQTLPSGALRITDLGYFSLEKLFELNADTVYWLTRVKEKCDFYDDNGKCWDLAQFLFLKDVDTIDIPISLGKKHLLPCRLLAVRVPDYVANYRLRKIREYAQKKGVTPSKKTLFLAGWTVMATNTEKELMSLEEAQILLRARWQIEMLFKLWKKYGKVDLSAVGTGRQVPQQQAMAYLDRSVCEITGYDYSALDIPYKLLAIPR
jgi:hypothetical protein